MGIFNVHDGDNASAKTQLYGRPSESLCFLCKQEFTDRNESLVIWNGGGIKKADWPYPPRHTIFLHSGCAIRLAAHIGKDGLICEKLNRYWYNKDTDVEDDEPDYYSESDLKAMDPSELKRVAREEFDIGIGPKCRAWRKSELIGEILARQPL